MARAIALLSGARLRSRLSHRCNFSHSGFDGDAAKSLDWLPSEPEAPAVLDGAATAQ